MFEIGGDAGRDASGVAESEPLLDPLRWICFANPFTLDWRMGLTRLPLLTDAAASAASFASDRWRSNLDTLSKSFFPNTRVLNHVSTRVELHEQDVHHVKGEKTRLVERDLLIEEEDVEHDEVEGVEGAVAREGPPGEDEEFLGEEGARTTKRTLKTADPMIVPNPTLDLAMNTPMMAVKSSGADPPAAMNVAPATSSSISYVSTRTSSGRGGNRRRRWRCR